MSDSRRLIIRLGRPAACVVWAAALLGACGPAQHQVGEAHPTHATIVVAATPPPSGAEVQQPQPSAPAQPVAAAHSSASTMNVTRTQPAGRIGHYSSNDGMAGFVFDRTASPAAVRLDGSNTVIQLTSRPGPYRSTEFVNPEAHIWIRVTEYGQVLFDGPQQTEGIDVYRDADANPLR